MNTSRAGILTVAIVLSACQTGSGDDASLFGDGGAQGPSDPAGDGSGSSTGLFDPTGFDDGTPTPPPPPPPPPGDDTGSTGEVEPDPSTDTGGGSTSEPFGSTGGSTGDSGSEGTDTFNDGTIDVQVSIQSMFPQGQCDDVVLTNISAMDVTWEVDLPLPGVIDQTWNCEVMEMPGMGTFTGAAFNATLAPGGQAMFGYCVLY